MAVKENKPIRVAVYCRVAKESQLAIDCQKNELTQYAHALGHINLAYYTDNGASGLTLDRPGFCQMTADIQAGKIGAVFVKDFTRLGRDMRQVLQWSNSMKRKGISVLSTGQPGEALVSPIMESISKAYASQRRKKRR